MFPAVPAGLTPIPVRIASILLFDRDYALRCTCQNRTTRCAVDAESRS